MIVCNVFFKVSAPGLSQGTIKKAVQKVLNGLEHASAEVAIHFVGTQAMRSLNRVHRGFDRPTDVLSFAASEGIPMSSDVKDVGDIFLCVPYIKRQAKEVGVSYQEECLRMLIHGILHAVGYDHGNTKDAKVMFGLQEQYLSEVL